MGVNPLQVIGAATSVVPTVASLAQGYQLRNDDLLNRIGEIGADRYNQVVQNNPYGDPYSGWGGSFGYNADGSAVGFGQAQAASLMQNIQNNPGQSALSAYQGLAQSQAPGMVDASAGMGSLLGVGGGQGTYQPSTGVTPNFQNPNAGTQFGSSVQTTGGQQPNPYLVDPATAGSPGINWLEMMRQSSGGNGGGSTPAPSTPVNPGGSGGNSGGFRQPNLGGYSQGGYGKALDGRDTGRGTTAPAQANTQAISPGQSQFNPNATVSPTGGQVTQPQTAAPANTVQQLFNYPVAYTDQMQQQMYNQQKQSIDAESAGALRQMRESAASGGMLNSGAYQQQAYQGNQDRMRALSAAQGGIQQRAAETNFGNLLQSANLQGNLTQGMGQLQLAQNQQRNDAYNAQVANTGRIIDQSYGLSTADMSRQQNAWNQLSSIGQTGMQLPEDYLANVRQNRYNQLAPGSIQSGPTYIGNQGSQQQSSGNSGWGQAAGAAAGYLAGNWGS